MEFLIYRKGSNAANQSLTFNWVPIAIVKARSRQEAETTSWYGEKPNIHGCPSLSAEILASVGNIDVWSNQIVKAVPVSKAKKSDWNTVLESNF